MAIANVKPPRREMQRCIARFENLQRCDTGLPDIWVMDSKVQFIDDLKPMQDTQILRVRGIEGVEWAVPLYKGLLKARLADGSFQT